MRKRMIIRVNGDPLSVMKGPAIKHSFIPPAAPKAIFPESPSGQSTVEFIAWMEAAVAAVNAANENARKKWLKERTPITRIRIEFPHCAWEGALRGEHVQSIDGGEIDKLSRLHLPDGRVIQGGTPIDLPPERISANRDILDMEAARAAAEPTVKRPRGKRTPGGKKHTFNGNDKWRLSIIIKEVIRGNRKAGAEPLEGAAAKAEILRRIKADPVLNQRVLPSDRMLDNWIKDVESGGGVRGSVPIKQPRTRAMH